MDEHVQRVLFGEGTLSAHYSNKMGFPHPAVAFCIGEMYQVLGPKIAKSKIQNPKVSTFTVQVSLSGIRRDHIAVGAGCGEGGDVMKS